MSSWLDPIQHRLCSRSRCQLPIAGVGEAYGLCDGHGHEERNRRLRERDAKARAVTQRPIVRGLTAAPKDRPLSAIVGARPTPPSPQPSAATVAAKEPTMAKPLTLKPNADELPPTVCHILDCDTFVGDGRGARGLCATHHAAAIRAGRLDELALPKTQRAPKPKVAEAIGAGPLPKKVRQPKAVAPTAPKPTPAELVPDEDLRVPSVVIPSSPSEELEKLRAERDAAVARAEAAEKAQAELQEAESDLLDESIEVAKALGLDIHGDYDLTARAREVMSILEFVRAERDAADAKLERVRMEIRAELDRVLAQICAEIGIDQDGGADWILGELHNRLKSDAEKIRSANAIESLLRHDRTGLIEVNAELRPWYAAAQECATALGVSTASALLDAAKALSMDQHPPATIQRPGLPALPESKPHRVAQAGGHDLGVLVGYVTEWGLFRVTEGAKKGAVYGCLYRAEPVERLVLGEPTPDRDVWVRTCIDEVTPHNIHTADGGRFRRSEWGPDRFAPVAKSTTSSAAPGEDDIPF